MLMRQMIDSHALVLMRSDRQARAFSASTIGGVLDRWRNTV